MSIEWGKNSRCWVGKTRAGYPRFEAWDSDGDGDGRWCLMVILNPGARPIEVSELHSLDEARQFATGMLTGLDGGGGDGLPVENHNCTVEEVPCIAPPLRL